MESKSQTQKILNALLAGQKLTALIALKKFNCMRIASRISEIKALGRYNIKTEMVKLKSGKRVAQYSIPL
jgi:hypothetical protein